MTVPLQWQFSSQIMSVYKYIHVFVYVCLYNIIQTHTHIYVYIYEGIYGNSPIEGNPSCLHAT